jgi:hypothetical protein
MDMDTDRMAAGPIEDRIWWALFVAMMFFIAVGIYIAWRVH